MPRGFFLFIFAAMFRKMSVVIAFLCVAGVYAQSPMRPLVFFAKSPLLQPGESWVVVR